MICRPTQLVPIPKFLSFVTAQLQLKLQLCILSQPDTISNAKYRSTRDRHYQRIFREGVWNNLATIFSININVMEVEN